MDGVMSGRRCSTSAPRHTEATRHLALPSTGNVADAPKELAFISFHLN